MKNFQAKPPSMRRYLIPACLFVLLALVFLTVLAVIQIRGNRDPLSDGTITRTVTVAGQRGEIFDCNGNLLVGNKTSYDLIFEYGAMPDTRREINASLLAILQALSDTGNGDRLARDYYVLEGTYPSLKFCSKLSDKDSTEYFYYKRFLQAHNMDEEKTDADDVVKYLVSRYKLSRELYSDKEITALLRLLYEMERVDFGAARLDFASLASLTFAKPDEETFPATRLAREVHRAGGSKPIVFNGANEAAVAAFLAGKIKFLAITDLVAQAVADLPAMPVDSVDAILNADRAAREYVEKLQKA
jgi:hypothetical protein